MLCRLLGTDGPLLVPAIVIALVLGALASAFAAVAGWFDPGRLTPARMVDALGRRGGDPVGHRRNHAKGVCFTGAFAANGAGADLSTAPMLAAGRYPVTGRFAIATGNPLAADGSARVRSMAVRVVAPDGQEWRSGMNTSPVFAVATPAAFFAMVQAAMIDPATGKPDPQAMPAFIAAHPETGAFLAWARSAPWTASYADQAYYGLNAFILTDARGTGRPVRWSMRPETAAAAVAPDTIGADVLAGDLAERLARGPLRWTMVMTLGQPDDPTDDATRPWPAGRREVAVGTLVVDAAQGEAHGPCRDVNFDPTILPDGIALSDDPLLAARSASYATSFDRRIAEQVRR